MLPTDAFYATSNLESFKSFNNHFRLTSCLTPTVCYAYLIHCVISFCGLWIYILLNIFQQNQMNSREIWWSRGSLSWTSKINPLLPNSWFIHWRTVPVKSVACGFIQLKPHGTNNIKRYVSQNFPFS